MTEAKATGSTFQEIEINAAADTVWQAIRSFHDMGWAPNVITSLDVVGDKSSDEAGAGRGLNGVVQEKLRTMDDEAKTRTSSIGDGPQTLSKG